jgi:hypothetical protein
MYIPNPNMYKYPRLGDSEFRAGFFDLAKFGNRKTQETQGQTLGLVFGCQKTITDWTLKP